MGTGRQFSKRMIITFQTYRRGMTYVAYNLYAVSSITDVKPFAFQNFLIAHGVKVGEACAEFRLNPVDTDGPVSSHSSPHGICRQSVGVYAQEIAHACALKLQITGDAIETHHMDNIPFDLTEYPL